MRRLAFLVAIAALAVAGCDDEGGGDKSSETKAPEPSKEGGLFGNAVFTYKCIAPSDAQCDNDELGAGAGGTSSKLPQIARGATFALTPQIQASAGPGDAPVITALHPDYATVNGETITAVKAGYTTLGYSRGADIVDLLNVQIVEATGLKIASKEPTTEFTDVSIGTGGVKATGVITFKFRVLPQKDDQPLAGSLPCKWTTSDVAIANLTTDPTDNIVEVVTGTKKGTATIKVELGPFTSDIPITVN